MIGTGAATQSGDCTGGTRAFGEERISLKKDIMLDTIGQIKRENRRILVLADALPAWPTGREMIVITMVVGFFVPWERPPAAWRRLNRH